MTAPDHKAPPALRSDRAGHGGLMSITGAPGGGPMAGRIPRRRPHGWAVLRDPASSHGAPWNASLRRGQWVQTSLLQAPDIFMLDFHPPLAYGNGRRQAARQQSPHQAFPPVVFKTLGRLPQYRHHGGMIWSAAPRRSSAPERVTPRIRHRPGALRKKTRRAQCRDRQAHEKKSTETWVLELTRRPVP